VRRNTVTVDNLCSNIYSNTSFHVIIHTLTVMVYFSPVLLSHVCDIIVLLSSALYTPADPAIIRIFHVFFHESRLYSHYGGIHLLKPSAPRDPFIGWNHGQRQKNLHRVVNNARFLILPWVHSKNMASKILGLLAKLPLQHWLHRCGYRPLMLETFVEQARFTGGC
jgi:hypothetical protein